MTRNKVFGINLLLLVVVAPIVAQFALLVGVIVGVVWLLVPKNKFVYLDCTGEDELILNLRALEKVGVFKDEDWLLWKSQNVREWGNEISKPHPSDGRRTNIYDGRKRFEIKVTRKQEVALRSYWENGS